MIRAVIFDLDGTLIDSINDIATCANLSLQHHGFPTHSTSRYKELVGDGLLNLARKVLPRDHLADSDVENFVDVYKGLYQNKWNETSKVYEGISELLTALSSRGIPLGVLSNKRDEFTRMCVSMFFPRHLFQVVRGELRGVPIKPDPHAALAIAHELGIPPQEVAFVGDSEIDIETGRRASMLSVGVSWGFRPRELLVRSGAEIIIDHPRELTSALSLAT